MKKLLSALLFLSLLATPKTALSDGIKISQLPLGSATTTGGSDSLPYVDATLNLTKRLTVWDLSNVPTIVSTYAPKISPSFSGSIRVTATANPYLELTTTTPAGNAFVQISTGDLDLTPPSSGKVSISGTGSISIAALTASTVPYLNSSKVLTSSAVTPTQLSYVDATSSIQTQLNGKQASGNYITALTGDVTASGPGSVAATLATVNLNTGSIGSSTAIPVFTVNGKGLITAASTAVVIAPAGTLTGATLAAGVTASSLTSVGTLTGGATGAGFTVALGTSTVSGTLPAANTAALTGDVTKTAGANSTVLAATTNATLTTLSALTTASSLVTVGTLTGGATGAGFTVALSTSTITGTLADARLPTSMATKTFTGVTTFPGTSSIDGSGNAVFGGTLAVNGSQTTLAAGVTPLKIAGDPTSATQIQLGATNNYSAVGTERSTGNLFFGSNAQYVSQADNWQQNSSGTASSLLDLGASGLSMYAAATSTANGNKATFWGSSVFSVSNAGAITSKGINTINTTGSNRQIILQPTDSTAMGIHYLNVAASGSYNWFAGAQLSATSTFEVTPSTATDGTTFSNPSFRIKQTSAGANVAIGTGANATNATGGFMYVPSSAGTPTGVPGTTFTGLVPMQYDTTNHKICVYDPTSPSWRCSAAM